VRKGIAGVALAVISLLLVAGCGSDSSTISRQEYERKLEIVCNDGLQKREDAFRVITQEYEELSEDEATPQVQNENLLKLIAVYEETTEEISEIDLPEGSEEKAEEMVQAREDATAKVEADPQSTRPKFKTIFKKSSDLAEEFGADYCVI